AVERIEQLQARSPTAGYPVKEGLPSNNAHLLFEDSRRDIWVSFVATSTPALCKWVRRTGRFHSFGIEDGLISSDTISSMCEDDRGNVWFGFGTRGQKGGVLARYRDGR